jgi:hypothetical protein
VPDDPVAWFKGFAAEWGDSTSIVGFVTTIIGFAVTSFGIWRSKRAADEARKAAIAARESIAHYDVIGDLSSATAFMDEIKRLQRHGVWAALPDRYSELRRRLVTIRASQAPLNDSQRGILNVAITTFAELEQRVDRAASTSAAPPNPAKLNEIVSLQIDAVQTVLLEVQRHLRAEG